MNKAIVFVLLISPNLLVLSAFGQDYERESLRDLKGVTVIMSIQGEIEQYVTETTIRAAVERELRSENIRVIDNPDTCSYYPGILDISITGYTLKSSYDNSSFNCVFSVSLDLSQVCYLVRDTLMASFGDTWTRSTIANSTISEIERNCKEIVIDYMTEFTNDYLAVNPKD